MQRTKPRFIFFFLLLSRMSEVQPEPDEAAVRKLTDLSVKFACGAAESAMKEADYLRVSSQKWRDVSNVLGVIIVMMLIAGMFGASVFGEPVCNIIWLGAWLLCPACVMTFARSHSQELVSQRLMRQVQNFFKNGFGGHEEKKKEE